MTEHFTEKQNKQKHHIYHVMFAFCAYIPNLNFDALWRQICDCDLSLVISFMFVYVTAFAVMLP